MPTALPHFWENNMPKLPEMPIWRDKNGNIIACTEKIKVMQQNMQELLDTAQDAFEDGLLMECTEAQLKDYLHHLVEHLHNPYN